MSDMSLVVAVRFEQGKVNPNERLLNQITTIMGREPDQLEEYDDGELDYFSYDLTKTDNFELNIFKETIFVDYIIKKERSCFNINLDIKQDELNKIVKMAESKGFKTEGYRLKVFYYYNGGCSGLNEVF